MRAFVRIYIHPCSLNEKSLYATDRLISCIKKRDFKPPVQNIGFLHLQRIPSPICFIHSLLLHGLQNKFRQLFDLFFIIFLKELQTTICTAIDDFDDLYQYPNDDQVDEDGDTTDDNSWC